MDQSIFSQIVNGRTDRVRDWLAQGGDAAAADDHGVRLIQWCAYHGDVDAIRLLVEQGERLESLGPNLDLNGAVFHAHLDLCRFLLGQGADPNHGLPGTAETSLHSALCKANRPEFDPVIRLLLEAGADPNAPTTPGVETGSFMRDVRTRGETPLHRAAAYGSEDAIQMLLEAGGDREARDAHGDSPLSWASWHLRPARILRLLCFGEFSIHPDA